MNACSGRNRATSLGPGRHPRRLCPQHGCETRRCRVNSSSMADSLSLSDRNAVGETRYSEKVKVTCGDKDGERCTVICMYTACVTNLPWSWQASSSAVTGIEIITSGPTCGSCALAAVSSAFYAENLRPMRVSGAPPACATTELKQGTLMRVSRDEMSYA